MQCMVRIVRSRRSTTNNNTKFSFVSPGPMGSYALLSKHGAENADQVRSMRAFFCDAVINWLHYCEDKNVDTDKQLDILEHTVQNYIEDVIRMDTVLYYKAQAELATLETSLCHQIVKDNIIKKVDSIENLTLFKPKSNRYEHQTLSSHEKENNGKEEEKKITTGKEIAEIEDAKKEYKVLNEGDKDSKIKEDEIPNKEKSETGSEDKLEEEIKESEHKENMETFKEEKTDSELVEEEESKVRNEVNRDLKEKDDSKHVDSKKRAGEGDLVCDKAIKNEGYEDQKQKEENINALQNFEKATNPNYKITPHQDEEEDGEDQNVELTREEKVQRIKELQEIISEFEATCIYSPNPSRLFDLVFKVLKTLGPSVRANELTELMNTHAEAFELA